MTILRGTSLGTLSLIGLLTGCDALFPGDPPSPYFHATLQGAVQAEYEGTGEFFWGSRSEELTTFSIDSWSEDGDERFYVQIFGSSYRAPAGSYAVTLDARRLRELRADGDAGPGWVLVMYSRGQEDGPAEYYVADAGTIEVTRSRAANYAGYINDDHGWVEGRFSLSAVRYCGGVQGVDYYCPRLTDLPDQLPPDLPQIEVTGSFVVTASDPRVYWDCDPICSDEG